MGLEKNNSIGNLRTEVFTPSERVNQQSVNKSVDYKNKFGLQNQSGMTSLNIGSEVSLTEKQKKMLDLKKALDEQIQHKENIKKISFKEPAKTHDGLLETNYSFEASQVNRPHTVLEKTKH